MPVLLKKKEVPKELIIDWFLRFIKFIPSERSESRNPSEGKVYLRRKSYSGYTKLKINQFLRFFSLCRERDPSTAVGIKQYKNEN